jgi:hypothetical protein
MEVHLRSLVPGGIRAVTFRNGVRRSVIYLGMDAVAYEQAAPPADESPTNLNEESEAPGRWEPFAGWYQIPRVGTAAVYGAVVEAESLALA